MKRPDLSYNHYFPFYTQEKRGKKKYYYSVETIIHLSDEEGILIRLDYERTAVRKVTVERINDRNRLFKSRTDNDYISYVDFAKEVSRLYNCLSKVQRELSSEQAYIKKLVFSSYFKYGNSVEFEMDYKKIIVKFGEINYRIVDGKYIRENEVELAEDSVMGKIGKTLNALQDQTEYKEVEHSDFEEFLNRRWEYFIDYFTAPKFINRKQYSPK